MKKKKIIFSIGFGLSIAGFLYCLYCFFMGRLPIGPQPNKYGDTSGASVASLSYGIACFIVSYFLYKAAVHKSTQRT